MNWVALIPVRAGSKGLANKNVRSVRGKPLYRYAVDFALDADAQKVYVTTDIEEILCSSNEKNIIITERNSALCQDDTQISSVILDFLIRGDGKKINDDQTIVLLQATSPLRKKSDLLKALELFLKSETTELMMAVTQAENAALKYGFVINGSFKHISEPSLCFENRQSLPKLFRPTGAFYIFKAGWYRSNKSFATKATCAYEIPSEQSLDIDSLEDIKRFEAILEKEEIVN
jgi:CMP-N-acetylneuraminic acid synthetase